MTHSGNGAEVELIKYDEGCRATAEAKDRRDKALAIQAYSRQAENKDLEADAFEIRIRAERKLGELLIAQKETEGFNSGGWAERNAKSCGANTEPQDRQPTLADMGLDKKLLARAQKMAAVPVHRRFTAERRP